MLRSLRLRERVPALHQSDTSFDDAPADLPLRDTLPYLSTGEPDAPPVHEHAERGLFASAGEGYDTRSVLDHGIGLGLAVAASLVVGLLVGFAGGFVAGQSGWWVSPSSAPADGAGSPARNPAGDDAAARNPAIGLGAAPNPVSGGADTAGRVPLEGPAGPPAAPGDERAFSEATVAPEPTPPRPMPTPEPMPSAVPRVDDAEPRAPAPRRGVSAAARASTGGSNRSASTIDGPVPTPARRSSTGEGGTGALQVLSRPPGAQVLVDGRLVGRTPLSIPGVRVGAHEVRIELPGFRRWATSVQVAPGDRTRVAASLEQ